MIPSDSPAWTAARVGILSASRFAEAISKTKTGWGASREKLMQELLAERLVGAKVDHYVTPAMQWGLDKEAEAWEQYEARTGVLVQTAGLFMHPRIEFLGATPDRLLPGGLGESKCPTSITQVLRISLKTFLSAQDK